MKSKYLIIFAMLLHPFIATPAEAFWPIYHKPEFKGKVVDAETKQPTEGAVVVVAYCRYMISAAGSITSVINVKEAITDKSGEFEIPSYTTLLPPFYGEDVAEFTIYKSGYGYPSTLYGLTLTSTELFFSSTLGRSGELEGMVDGHPNRKVTVTFGIVELPKVKTREERLKAIPESPTGFWSKELPLLYNTINEERKRLGLSGEVN